MAQLAIYINDKIAREIKRACRRAGVSRSQWVSQIIKKELLEGFPEEFFRTLGSWEDDRSPEEILKEIRQEFPQRERPPLR